MSPITEPRARPAGTGRTLWQVLKTVQARLRFIVILAAVGAVISYWDTLQAYYEKWVRPAAEASAAAAGLEFWCPMHPTIIRDKPDKCPICGMPLSKRKQSEAEKVTSPLFVKQGNAAKLLDETRNQGTALHI